MKEQMENTDLKEALKLENEKLKQSEASKIKVALKEDNPDDEVMIIEDENAKQNVIEPVDPANKAIVS